MRGRKEAGNIWIITYARIAAIFCRKKMIIFTNAQMKAATITGAKCPKLRIINNE
jgi:hypothetical protein